MIDYSEDMLTEHRMLMFLAISLGLICVSMVIINVAMIVVELKEKWRERNGTK